MYQLDAAVMAVLDRNMKNICALKDKKQMVEASLHSVAVLVALIRAERGDEFTDGFLTAAIEDPLRVKVVPVHTVQ